LIVKTKYFVAALLVVIFAIYTPTEARTFKGYVKTKTVLLNGDYLLSAGESIECELSGNEDKCCFEEEVGTICINTKLLSSKPVEKPDLYFKKILFSTNADNGGACREGVGAEQIVDSFVWSYGFVIGSKGVSKDQSIIVVVDFYLVTDAGDIPIPSMKEVWNGPLDNRCHEMNYYGKTIEMFIYNYRKDYEKAKLEKDLNVEVRVIFRLLSSMKESKYSNNKKEFITLLPIDNKNSWPTDK
jgi:hypothetical protein